MASKNSRQTARYPGVCRAGSPHTDDSHLESPSEIKSGGRPPQIHAPHHPARWGARWLLEFVKDQEICQFGGLGGPGGLGNPSKRCGASPRTFSKGFPGPRGRPDPQNGRISGSLKSFKFPAKVQPRFEMRWGTSWDYCSAGILRDLIQDPSGGSDKEKVHFRAFWKPRAAQN